MKNDVVSCSINLNMHSPVALYGYINNGNNTGVSLSCARKRPHILYSVHGKSNTQNLSQIHTYVSIASRTNSTALRKLSLQFRVPL